MDPNLAAPKQVTAREVMQPAKTDSRECLIARMAVMRKVLSPISVSMIMRKELSKPCQAVGEVVWTLDIFDIAESVCVCESASCGKYNRMDTSRSRRLI